MKCAIAVALFLVSSMSMEAQSLPESLKTANDFVKVCQDVDAKKASRDPMLAAWHGYCLGYLNGLIVSNQTFYKLKLGTPLYCPPSGVTPSQARKIFLKYVDEHPEKLHEDATAVITVSLGLAFPCNQQDTK